MVNVETSTIARESHVALPILAGPEIGVASTKAFTCQLTVLAALAHRRRPAARPARRRRRRRGWSRRSARAPGLVARALALEPQIAEIARDLARARDVLFLGRGPMYPLALEGALKLKEISYIHAEGYASGELKHGPIALIDEDGAGDRAGALRRALRQDRLEHAGGDGARRQGAARSATPRASPTPARAPGATLTDARRPTPSWRRSSTPRRRSSSPTTPPSLKGTDVDQPRNLAKSVTVE